LSAKDELLEIIFAAGLTEDFLNYLKSKRVDLDGLRSIYEVDEALLLEYARERRLVEGFDSPQEEEPSEQNLEPAGLRPRTPPRKPP